MTRVQVSQRLMPQTAWTVRLLLQITCLLVTLGTSAASLAEQAESSPAPATSSAETQPRAAAESQDDKKITEQLKRRELGQAFELFTPSEEISADNAVPFPHDI